MTDISRTFGKHKKRDVSVMSIELNASEMGAVGAYEVGVLPTNILILTSTLVTLIDFDGTTPTVAVGFGAAELIAATAIDAGADTVDAGNGGISVQTGPVVIVDKLGTSTVGKAVFEIEYIEYEQCTGELTNFLPAP